MRVNVRNKRVVQTVGTFEEKSNTTSDETDKCGARVRVHGTGDDHEHTRKSDIRMEKNLLAPGSRRSVCIIRDHATQGAEDDVQESKHGSPIARILETELKVGAVVGSEDAVDGQLATESAEVADTEDQCLGREDDRDGVLEGWLLNDFTTDGVKHLLLAHLSFIVAKGAAGFIELLLFAGDIGGGRCAGILGDGFLAGDLASARDGDDGAFDSVRAEVGLGALETVSPLASGSVFATEEEGQGDSSNQDARNNEGNTPSNVAGETVVLHKRGVDGRHDEVSDTTTGVTETGSQGVGGTNNVLIVETSCPYLARHERATKNTNEESENVEASSILDGTSQEGRDSTKKQAASECVSGTEAITSRASNQTNKESGSQGDDIGIGDFVLADVDVLGNDIAEQWRECIPMHRVSHRLGKVAEIRMYLPRPESQQEAKP